MDAITHTILAMASIAGAYHGGRWLLIREAREAFGESPELKREMQLMTAIIERMTKEDEAYNQRTKGPRRMDLFQESKHGSH